jgi:glycosyltransferase involved in cell wall biosynthesis
MNQKSRVSVVTSFLDAERFFEEAIESVFAQTYVNWELLLVDDGSTDASSEIARMYANQFPDKVKYLEHVKHTNQGQSAARNLGINHAQGEFIALLDVEDVWLPNKLERQVAILEAHPEAAMVCGATQHWYSWTGNAEDLARDHVSDLGVQPDTLFEPPILFSSLYPLDPSNLSACDLLMRHALIERIGGFEESFPTKYQERSFLAKVYLREAVFVSGECWSRHRMRPDSHSSVAMPVREYDPAGLLFLIWIEAYLSEHGIKDAGVLGSLRKALAPYLEPKNWPAYAQEENIQKFHWWLRVAEGNVADFEFRNDKPDWVRIRIQRAETKTSHDIQLNQPRLQVRSTRRYVISFLARADRPRTIVMGFSRASAPWANLGLYTEIELTSEWQSFEQHFVAAEDDDDARIHFDIGQSDISVEFSSVRLRRLSEGESIEPHLRQGPN